MNKKVRLFLYDRDNGSFFNTFLSDEEKYAYFDSLGEAYSFIKEVIKDFDLEESDLVAEIDFV